MTIRAIAICLSLPWIIAGCTAKGQSGGRLPDPPKPPPAAPAYQPKAIDPGLRERARRQINEAFESNDQTIQMNSVEALKYMGSDGQEAILVALSDSRGPVRYAAALAAGELRLVAGRPALEKIAEEKNPHHRIAARFALHRTGDTSRSHDLEKYARDANPLVRRDTAMVLGMLGEPSAMNVLRDMQKDRDTTVRIQVAEARWRLGDSRAMEELIVGIASGFPDDQMICLLAVAQRGDTRVAQHVYARLTDAYAEVGLVAARSLGMLGYDDGLAVALNSTASSDPRQRHLAAFALGSIGRNDARCQDALAKLLADNRPEVRVAAATAIFQLKPPGQEPQEWISKRPKKP